MKKIPKFDQKAWDEKQAKVAEEASGKSLAMFPYSKKAHDKMMEEYNKIYGDILKNQKRLGQGHIFIAPSGKVSAGYSDGSVRPLTVGDPMDNLIFNGGEDGDRDKDLRLPQGHNDNSWYSYDPAFKQEERCCKPEDKVNVGFMQDKWACKICGKDM